MATRKAGSRRIVVDDVAYRWRIRRRHTLLQTGYGTHYGRLHVAVQLDQEPSTVLVLWTNRTHPADIDAHPRDITPIRPSDVVRWIRLALQAGWIPAAKGPQYHLRVDGAPAERQAIPTVGE